MFGMKRLVAFAVVVALAGFAAPLARAQSKYPDKPIHVIVGFIPGSAADITARVLGNKMSQILGQQLVIENKPGAGSSLAADYAAHAPNDGYTLFVGSSANVTNTAINPKMTDIGKDLAPIALINTAAVVLVVNPNVKANSVKELMTLAKSKPGELLYASTGVGTAPHLSGELFNMRAGVKMVHVPYQGSPQAVTDLLADRVNVMFSPASAVIPQVNAGKLRLLASAATKRPGIVPDTPTMAEAGMPDFDTSIWFGLMAPLGTAKDIIGTLAKATREAVQSPDVVAAWKPQGIDPLNGGPDEFARHLEKEVKRWNDVAVAAGLKK